MKTYNNAEMGLRVAGTADREASTGTGDDDYE